MVVFHAKHKKPNIPYKNTPVGIGDKVKKSTMIKGQPLQMQTDLCSITIECREGDEKLFKETKSYFER